ncbi:hypothetical protein HZA97_04640 [Candidatus Woesearchaeota archaeon]|nr:hypothetical protein [Candidatus Woesearchaeota archaeon]
MYRFADDSRYALRPNIKGNAWVLTGDQGELQYFEQITLADGNRIRFFYSGMDATTRTLTGTLLTPKLTKKEEDYARFKNLTDRLNELTQVKIKNTQQHYLDYLRKQNPNIIRLIEAVTLQAGLAQGLAAIKLNTSNNALSPNDTLFGKSKALGYICSGSLYLAGIGVAAYQGASYNDIFATSLFSILGDFLSGIIITRGEMLLSSSALFTAGSILISEHHANKRNKQLWKNAKDVEAREKSIKEINGLIAQVKTPSYAREVLESQKKEQETTKDLLILGLQAYFEETKYYGRGLSISFRSKYKDNLLDLFNYLLSDGKIPIPFFQSLEPIQTTAIDPWCELIDPEVKVIDPWCDLREPKDLSDAELDARIKKNIQETEPLTTELGAVLAKQDNALKNEDFIQYGKASEVLKPVLEEAKEKTKERIELLKEKIRRAENEPKI